MIARDTIRIDAPLRCNASVLLAPYGVTEMNVAGRLDDKGRAFQPLSDMKIDDDYTIEQMVEERASADNFTEWGVYAGQRRPDCFLGTVSLTESFVTDPLSGDCAQEVGLTILQSNRRLQGVGTLATLGAVTYATRHYDTQLFEALTSEYNGPAQTVLHHVGFSLMDTVGDWYDYPAGESTQYWVLTQRDWQRRPLGSCIDTSLLPAGWRRHGALAQAATVTIE